MFYPIPVLSNCGSGPSFGFKSFRRLLRFRLFRVTCQVGFDETIVRQYAGLFENLYADEFGEKIIGLSANLAA